MASFIYATSPSMASSPSSSSLDGFAMPSPAYCHQAGSSVDHHHALSPRSSTDSKQRMRIAMACVHCRARKIRCDGIQPACATCIRLKRSCAYEHVTGFENMLTRERKARGKEAKLARMAISGSQSPSRGTPKPTSVPSSQSMQRSISRPYPRRAVTSYEASSSSSSSESRIPRRRGVTVAGHEAQPLRPTSPLHLLSTSVSASTFQCPSMDSSNGFSLPTTPAWPSFPTEMNGKGSYPSVMNTTIGAVSSPYPYDQVSPHSDNVSQWLGQQQQEIDSYATPESSTSSSSSAFFAPSWPLEPSASLSSNTPEISPSSPIMAAPSPMSSLPTLVSPFTTSSFLGLDLKGGDVQTTVSQFKALLNVDDVSLSSVFPNASLQGLMDPPSFPLSSSPDLPSFESVPNAQSSEPFFHTSSARRPSESLHNF